MKITAIFVLAAALPSALTASAADKVIPTSQSQQIQCSANKAGVLGLWDSNSKLLNQVSHNLSLIGVSDRDGHVPLVTMNGTKPVRSERFVFWQCNSTSIPQPKNLYYQIGQIRLESDPTVCLTIKNELKPRNGRLVGSKCATADHKDALARQSFEYDYYDNLAFFNGGASNTERTFYRYSRYQHSPNKRLRISYSPVGVEDGEARTALRISPQSTTPQTKKRKLLY